MPKRPFELRGRRIVEGGVSLIFQCTGCGEEAALLIRDGDPLKDAYAVACRCGVEANMYFGSPLVGRALLKSLKATPEPEDNYHRCRSPLLN